MSNPHWISLGFAEPASKFSSFLLPDLLLLPLVHNKHLDSYKHLIPQTPSHGLLLKNPVCDTKCLFKPIAHFPIELSAFCFLPVLSAFFYLIWIQVLCQIHVWQISLPLQGLLFHFFIVFLNRSPLFGYNSVSQFSFLFRHAHCILP